MLIKVLLKEGEEGLFNADCQVAFLLDAIKQKHDIPRTEEIDLCSEEAAVLKNLSQHGDENGKRFFETREVCLVVLISEVNGKPYYTPALPNYAKNEEFVVMLNQRTALQTANTWRLKVKQKSQSSASRAKSPNPGQPNKPKSSARSSQKQRKHT